MFSDESEKALLIAGCTRALYVVRPLSPSSRRPVVEKRSCRSAPILRFNWFRFPFNRNVVVRYRHLVLARLVVAWLWIRVQNQETAAIVFPG
jgi:hypothetical protein